MTKEHGRRLSAFQVYKSAQDEKMKKSKDGMSQKQAASNSPEKIVNGRNPTTKNTSQNGIKSPQKGLASNLHGKRKLDTSSSDIEIIENDVQSDTQPIHIKLTRDGNNSFNSTINGLSPIKKLRSNVGGLNVASGDILGSQSSHSHPEAEQLSPQSSKKKKRRNKNKKLGPKSQDHAQLASPSKPHLSVPALTNPISPKQMSTVRRPDNSSTPSVGMPSLKLPFLEKVIGKLPLEGSSSHYGEKTFQWLLHPIEIQDFFSSSWEKCPLLIKRKNTGYYQDLLTTKMFDDMLRNQKVLFGKNLDVTSYKGNKRETLNREGRAHGPIVWDFYNNGCSVRLLNPQTFHDSVWDLCASLQEFFGTFVGSNVYLTPPDSQGFAPHYDDIEAFILQLEGKKRWRLYKPRTPAEYLPRFSSPNFNQDEIGEPILDVTLEPGDLLYFPRGTIHQGNTIDGQHSLHITLSCYQLQSWGDFLNKLVPLSLQKAIDNDSSYREGLPLEFLHHLGIANSESRSSLRKMMIKRGKELLIRLIEDAAFDEAADQIAKEIVHSSLPPYLSTDEKRCCLYGDGERMADGKVFNRSVFDLDTRVKLLRKNILRVVTEDLAVKVYFSNENSREYRADEAQFLEVKPEDAPAIEYMIHKYPSFVRVQELPIQDDSQKLQVTADLWEHGLLLTDKPLSD